jgi:hypothetical protein
MPGLPSRASRAFAAFNAAFANDTPADVGCGPRLCENSEVQFARRSSVSLLVDFKTNSDNHRRKKGIEKTILRNLGSRTFSHSLGPNRKNSH